MNQAIHIRYATQKDADILAQNSLLLAKELKVYLSEKEKRNIQKGISEPLIHQKYGFFLVGEINEKIAISCFVSRNWDTWKNGEIWTIFDLYVLSEFRKKGCFRALFTKLESLAEKNEICRGLRLFVLPENTIAKKAYASLGMRKNTREIWEKFS